MKIKLRIITSIIASTLTLSGCQTVSNKSSEPLLIEKTDELEGAPIILIGIVEGLDTDSDGVIDDWDACPNTPNSIVVDARGCPIQPIGTGLKMEYRGFFAKGSSELSKEYQFELDRVAQKLQEYETATMVIEGHASADEILTTDIVSRPNSLSMNRAIIVKNYLIMKHKIDPNRLSTSSFGAERPIASSDTEEEILESPRLRSSRRTLRSIVFDRSKDLKPNIGFGF